MPMSQAESVIKNIIREIVSECATKGQAVSETLVAFMVKAVVLDPKNAFSTEKTLTRDDVQKLIRVCVDRLLDTRSPSLDTIKMQIFFDMNYTSRRDFLEEHRRAMESRLQPVIREITDSRARTREEYENLYRKIVSSVLLRSGLGSPTDINVVREATAALQSVFPQSELGTFLEMKKDKKEQHLLELTNIITGIRLFNKDSGKGGEGIDDLPSFLNEGIPTTCQTIEMDMQKVRQWAFQYTNAVEKLDKQPSGKANEQLTRHLLCESIINCRQHEALLTVLLGDVYKAAEHVKTLLEEFNNRMMHLRQTIQNKHAVPTAQVYPQFVQLAENWSAFQDEVVLLSVLTNILNNLGGFSNSHLELFPEKVLAEWIDLASVKTDKDRLEETKSDTVNPNDFREHVWLFPSSTKNFEKLTLQFRGYCGWSLVKYDRLLVPGNPNIGVLRFQGNYYAFSSRQAAEEFADAPDLFLRAIADCARKSPELIQLLELHQQFSTIAPYSQSGGMVEKPITKADAAIQTDTHFMESNIVKSYEWNEWELRRKALKLANLKTKATHSVQTHLSNFRRANVTQMYLPKNQETQTTKDNYSNVPKPSVFHAGVRGACVYESTVYRKVDLTIPVEQQLLGTNNGKPS